MSVEDQNMTPEDAFDAAFEEKEPQQTEPKDNSTETDPVVAPTVEDTPAADEETGKNGDEGQSGDQLEELRRRAHGYDSMRGRLAQEQKKTRDLEAQIAALQAQSSLASDNVPQTPAATEKTEQTPQYTREMEELIQEIPENRRSLFKEDSADGKRLRSVLDDLGPDYALIAADSIMDRRENNQAREKDLLLAKEEKARRQHFDLLSDKFPEFSNAFHGDLAAQKVFQDSLNEFIGRQPYQTGVRYAHIAEQGSLDESIELLTAFQKYRNGGQTNAVAARKQAAANGFAVPSRNTPPMRPAADAQDYDAAFDEAMHSSSR